MHLNIQGRHLPITPALNKYVKTKTQKVKYYFEHIIYAHVVLQKNKDQFIAEVTLTVEQHHFHNKVSTEDMYKSIDFLFDKLERQVRRYKEALIDRKRRSHTRIHEEQYWQWHTRELTKLEETNKIFIDDLAIASKPMGDLEAVLQLDANTKRRIMGFYSVDHDDHLSFLVQEATMDKFSLIAYDNFWEFTEIELCKAENGHTKMELHNVERITPSLESIEDALDFLLHNDSRYRFFTSLRTGTQMLLYERNLHHFRLLRGEH